jgi:hypothetical protein
VVAVNARPYLPREDGMNDTPVDATAQQRLLESWLPLAQAESERHGWGYDGPSLEQLILLAAPSLRDAPTLLAARACFWHYHQRMERGER